MKFVNLLFLGALLSYQIGFSQPDYNYRWHREFTTCNSGLITGVVSMNNGDIIAMMRNSGQEDIDMTPVDLLVPTGGTIVCYNDQKSLLWHQTFPNMQSGKLLIDSLHNAIYIYDSYTSFFDADPGVGTNTFTSVGQGSSFVIKLDLSGNFLWARNIVSSTTSNSHVTLTGLAVKESGDLILYGSFRNGADFDPGPGVQLFQTPNGSSGFPITQGFLIEWDSNGDYSNGLTLGQSDFGFTTSNVNVLDQNIFFACTTYGQMDVDASPSQSTIVGNAAQTNSFVIKYDTNFVYKSVAFFSMSGLHRISTGYNDDLVLSGDLIGDFDADPTSGSFILDHPGASTSQQYVIKLDTAFNFQWAFYNPYLSSGDIDVRKVILANDGSIHCLGEFRGEYDADPSSGTHVLSNTNNSNMEPYVIQYDNDGNFIDGHVFYHIGTNYFGNTGDIDVNPNKSVLVGLGYRGTTDVDPGASIFEVLLPGTSPKPLLVEFKRCIPQYTNVYDSICDGEAYFFGGQNYFSSGNYTYSFVDSYGCDSIVTLHLIVNQLQTEISIPSFGTFACVDTNYASYNWMNCSTGSLIPGATSYTYAPLNDEPHAVVISDGLCFDTSNCFFVTQGSNFGVPKLDWAASIPGFTGGENNCIAVDLDGNFYVAGYIHSVVNMELFGGVSSFYQSPNSNDLMIAKYDNNGNFIWGYTGGIQGTSAIDERALSLDFDTQGNVYVAGLYENTFDIDPDEYSVVNQVDSDPSSCCGYEVFLIKINANGQLVWNKTVGGIGVSMTVEDFDVAPNGDLVVCGRNTGQDIDFDPGPGIVMQTGNAYAAKYSSDGNFIGAIDLPGYYSIIKAATFDKDNNLILSGMVEVDADFDMGPGQEILDVTSFDGSEFIVSYDESLDLNWLHPLDPSGSETNQSALDTDDDGNIFFSGVNSGLVDFSGNGQSWGASVFNFFGLFLVKYAQDGTFIKKFPLTASGSYFSNSIDVNPQNEVLFSCKQYIGNAVVVNPSLTLPMISGGTAVIKYSNDGNESWGFELADYNSSAAVTALASDDFGNFFLIGDGFNANPFDADPSDSTYIIDPPDAYIAKYGESCAVVDNSYQFTGSTLTVSDNGYYYFKDCNTGLVVDSSFSNSFTPCSTGSYYAVIKNGNCYDSTDCVSVVINSSVSLIPNSNTNLCQGDSVQFNLSTANICDPEIHWFINGIETSSSQNNNYVHYGLAAEDSIYAMVVSSAADTLYTDTVVVMNGVSTYSNLVASECNQYVSPSGQVISISGTYLDTIPNLNGCDSIMSLDITILNSSSYQDVVQACDSFLWMNGVTYYNSTNSPTFVSINSEGCDSTIQLNLTINEIDETVTAINDSVLHANTPNSTYQWLDCDNNFSEILGETGQSFVANENGNYAVVVSSGGCTDTSLCMPIMNLGFIETTALNQILAFPNPTNGLVYINLGKTHSSLRIQLIDMYGKLIDEMEFIDVFEFELKIEGAPGYYLVKLLTDEYHSTIGIVKE